MERVFRFSLRTGFTGYNTKMYSDLKDRGHVNLIEDLPVLTGLNHTLYNRVTLYMGNSVKETIPSTIIHPER